MKVTLTLLCSILFCAPVSASSYFEVLVVGSDSRSISNFSGNTDVMMLISLNESTYDLHMCSFYRDTYVNVDGNFMKLNAVYAKYGIDKLISTINEYYDLNIEKYAITNWASISSIIDKIGGVDISITDKEFEYINAFIHETALSLKKNPENHYIKSSGLNHLDGIACTSYGRLRLMDTDYTRTERQKKVAIACYNKIKKIGIGKTLTLLPAMLTAVNHNLNILEITNLAARARLIQIKESLGVPDKYQKLNVSSSIYPKSLTRTVSELHKYLYGKNHIPSKKVEELDKLYKEIK